ncbi:MAG TPA: L-threonylcarbamoyladenylate synthase [Gemmatimonadales bacterium]|nr:L-threonylcarbamoyladenylate synthase [Gemmatimonadales bacterium]
MTLPFRTPTEIEAALGPAVEHLRRDGLLGYPTETIYGLGSLPSPTAVEGLARLKGREPGKPFLLLVSGREMAERFGLVFTPAAEALARAFWPGPLTLVLRGTGGKLPESLLGPDGGFGVRHSPHRGIARLLEALEVPLTSTSANRAGEPPAPGADRLVEIFAPAVERGELLVLDGGVLGNVPPSTVVDCTRPLPRLVRVGALPRDELRRVAGRWAP